MVSLSKIEKDIEDALAVEELEICATAQADEKKGERIILLTNLPLELKTLKDNYYQLALIRSRYRVK